VTVPADEACGRIVRLSKDRHLQLDYTHASKPIDREGAGRRA